MPETPVPVSMGSPQFITDEADGLLVTCAWFPPGASLHAHIHERATFAVMLDGGFDLRFTNAAIRRSELTCDAGTIFTEPAEEKHANAVFEKGARVVVIQPDPTREDLLRPCRRVFDRINHFRHGAISTAARRLARELRSPDDVTPISLEALALEMLVEAARTGESGRLASGRPGWMRRAREYVHGHFREPIRVADVAGAAGVHPAHLAGAFREAHRMTLGRYIRSLRVQWAADRLVETDDPISSIAFDAGFADQSHLTRVFKRQTGWTPGTYRKVRRG